MQLWNSQFPGFLLGIVGSFIASAIYDNYRTRHSKHAGEEAKWKERLSSPDEATRGRAYREVLMRLLRWYVLGNVMFGISGMAWIVDFFKAYELSNAVAAGSSLVAVLMFGVALSWIKRYLRYATP